MISDKVRLTRKFSHRKKLDYQKHLLIMLRSQMIFQLLMIFVYCLFNFSFNFHLYHVVIIFCSQFWTDQMIANSNLAFAACIFLIIPYLLLKQHAKLSTIRDLIGSIAFFHIMFSLLINWYLTWGYIFYVSSISIVGMIIGSYASIIVQQRVLVTEIQNIQSLDRQTLKHSNQESHHLVRENDDQFHI